MEENGTPARLASSGSTSWKRQTLRKVERDIRIRKFVVVAA